MKKPSRLAVLEARLVQLNHSLEVLTHAVQDMQARQAHEALAGAWQTEIEATPFPTPPTPEPTQQIREKKA